MNGLSTSWKFFRIVCIVQLVLVAFQGMLSFSGLFSRKSAVMSIIELVVYTFVFVFVYEGLSLLNYNYPDVPLSTKQKRSFNFLYLANFLFIAFLFARVVNTWWIVPFILKTKNLSAFNWFYIIVLFAFSWFIFIIHLVFLGGMFRLRRLIHQNTVTGWYEQFDKKAE